jgi:hypothetical protein
MGDQLLLTHDERETLERLRRLSRRYVGGLVPQAAVGRRPDDLDRLVASRRVRRYEATGPYSRAHGVVHVYFGVSDPGGPCAGGPPRSRPASPPTPR